MRAIRTSMLATALALSLLATGCGGGDGDSTSAALTPTPSPAPAPVPTPDPPRTSFNVNPCLNQQVANGMTVANLVVPDTLQVDFNTASGFPNGRRLADPVIDITIAILFLDMKKVAPTALANVPINPAANDLAFRTEFPYLAAPQGNPPLSPTGGSNFDFRTDPVTAYSRVDRMGMPAVATVVISSAAKTGYNDDNPATDLTGKSVNEIAATLTGLTNALADDFTKAGFPLCATPPVG